SPTGQLRRQPETEPRRVTTGPRRVDVHRPQGRGRIDPPRQSRRTNRGSSLANRMTVSPAGSRRERGLFSCSKPSAGGHLTVVTDTPRRHPDVPGPPTVQHEEVENGTREEDRVHGREKTREIRSGKHRAFPIGLGPLGTPPSVAIASRFRILVDRFLEAQPRRGLSPWSDRHPVLSLAVDQREEERAVLAAGLADGRDIN